MNMIISACSDEISTDLAVALDVLKREEIQYVDLRRVGGKDSDCNVVEVTDDQAAELHKMILRRGFTVTALSTPIGKTPITDDFAFEEARFARALELAQRFGAPFIRVFSFYVAEENAAASWDEAVRRLGHLCEMARPYGITLAHENEEGGFCAWRPSECLALHQALPDNFRAVFEPCSFVVVGYDALSEALPLLRPYTAYVHVRDTRRGTTEYSVVGEGDVRWRQILADLQAHDFQGYVTLEPHLTWQNYGEVTDTARTEYFHRAAQALRAALP